MSHAGEGSKTEQLVKCCGGASQNGSTGCKDDCNFKVMDSWCGPRFIRLWRQTPFRLADVVILISFVTSTILSTYLMWIGSDAVCVTAVLAGGNLLWSRNANHLQMARTDPFGKRVRERLLDIPFMIGLLSFSYLGIMVTGLRQVFRIYIMPRVTSSGTSTIAIEKLLPNSFLADGIGVVVIAGLTAFFITRHNPTGAGVWASVVTSGFSCFVFDLVRVITSRPDPLTPVLNYVTLQMLVVIALNALIFGAALVLFTTLPKHHLFKRIYARLHFHEPRSITIGPLLGHLFLTVSSIVAAYWTIAAILSSTDTYKRPISVSSDSIYRDPTTRAIGIIAGGVILLLLEIGYAIAWRLWRKECDRVNDHVGMELEEWTSCCSEFDKTHYSDINIFSSRYLETTATINVQVHAVSASAAANALVLIVVGSIWLQQASMIADAIGTILNTINALILFRFLRQTDEPPWEKCKTFAYVKQFVDAMGIDERFMDKIHNRCYCLGCTARVLGPSQRMAYWAGDPARKYTLPLGWSRFGVKVDETFAQSQQIFKRWNQSYHGTAWNSVGSILQHHQLLLPGDILLDGTQLNIREGHIEDQIYVYTTPTIVYASRNYYAIPAKWGDSVVRVVLECLQQPESVTIGPETIGWSAEHPDTPLDPAFSNDELEWFTKRRVAIVITGILVRDDSMADEDGRGDAMMPMPMPDKDLPEVAKNIDDRSFGYTPPDIRLTASGRQQKQEGARQLERQFWSEEMDSSIARNDRQQLLKNSADDTMAATC